MLTHIETNHSIHKYSLEKPVRLYVNDAASYNKLHKKQVNLYNNNVSPHNNKSVYIIRFINKHLNN